MIRACVVGWPIGHSRSPLIHGHWIARQGLKGSYDARAVAPDDLPRFLASLDDHGLAGANLTVPHKEAAFRLIADVDAAAAAIGAVNTVWLDGGRLRATNTDAHGYLANLDATVPDWQREARRALVIGAGGAARAVVFGLVGRGIEAVSVANRSVERAEVLGAGFARTTAHGFDALPALLGEADLVINTTTLGMKGSAPLDLPLDRLKPSAVVSDIVYVPLETALLREARTRGHRTVEGLGMLLHQAVPAFERWFGVRPTVTPELYALIKADIEKAAP